jgi:site-specific DNA recombinase
VDRAREVPGGIETVIAASYARKSTDQTGVADDAKSVTRQTEGGTAFIESKPWSLGPVFQDDGISGAEFERRPGFVAMMDAARAGGFQVLVISEESRLGRSTDMVPYVLAKLDEAGVEVWCYREARRIQLTTPVEKFMVSATSFAADMERHLARGRAYEAAVQRHKRGHVTGGLVFGYRNVKVESHVERVIDLAEAAVVRALR